MKKGGHETKQIRK